LKKTCILFAGVVGAISLDFVAYDNTVFNNGTAKG
jgi:hypothetical protein